MAPLRVCYFVNPGLTRFGVPAPRDAILQKALRLRGVEVVVCHEDARNLKNVRVPYLLRDTHPLLPSGLLRRYLRLVRRFFSMPRCDVLVVGEQGHGLVPLAWLLSKLTRAPLVFDPLFSLYDSSVLDRRVAPPRSGRALLLFLLDLLAFRLPRRLLADTPAHARYYSAAFGVPPSRIAVIPIGAEEDLFRPAPPPGASGGPLRVLFQGTYIPLHGVEHIFQAIRALEERSDIRFILLGHFYAEPSYTAVARALPGFRPRNAEFVEWLPYEQVGAAIARADLCLGIFGTTSKAARVVPHKAYQALAVGRPLITGDTPASRELLRHGEDAWLCPPGDGEALARAILHLKDRPEVRERLAREGRRAFEERFSARALGRALEEVLRGLL